MLLTGGDKASSSLSVLFSINSNPSPSFPLCPSKTRSHLRLFSRKTSQPLILFSQSAKIQPWCPPLPSLNPVLAASSSGTSVEHLAGNANSDIQAVNSESSLDGDSETFDLDKEFQSTDLRKLKFSSPSLEVKELEELPENWRRSKIAWLCKELPAHKRPTMTRLLNAQKKWIRQEDTTYLAVHCMRIRENEAGFWVYKWMIQQHWFRFDFALATKLGDYMGRERKYAKCREIFDDIINQGRVPSESTFHILIVAYLSNDGEDCLIEACDIYNRMIQLGGYRPKLTLHNALFRAIVGKPGSVAKKYLKQAEYIFHNLVTSELGIHKDVYGGLIWLHSYQETVDRARLSFLRKEMKVAGFEEGRDVLLSILRSSSKYGDVEEAEETWLKLRRCDHGLLSQAYVYRMEVYAKAKKPLKSLEIFREMEEQLGSLNVVAYHKILKILCEAQEIQLAEPLMKDLIQSNLKPIMPSYLSLMNMYFRMSLHDGVESAFLDCLQRCQPNRAIYSIYLDSLVQTGSIEKAGAIFNQMLENGDIGVNSRSCNTILRGYLSCGDNLRAGKLYQYMQQKKYDVDATLMDEVDSILKSSRKISEKPLRMKLSQEQREILVGLLLGGLRIESDGGKQHYAEFEFKDDSSTHPVLARHIFDQFREWLHPSILQADDDVDEENLPRRFFTVPHAHFSFYADSFWSSGRPTIPKLVHRWLSPRVVAYWYMYSGCRTPSGDIVLKLKGDREGVERVISALRTKSLNLKVKQKGRVYWLGFLGENSRSFWEMVKPFVLDGLKPLLEAIDQEMDDGNAGAVDGGFGGSESDDYDENSEDYDGSK